MIRLKYATTLRCIAQDLELRGLKTFDIRPNEHEYVVDCGYREIAALRTAEPPPGHPAAP